MARGEFVALLDHDDKLHPDALALRRRGARRRPRGRLRLHRRGQDRPRRAPLAARSSSPTGRRSGCGRRCTPATSASCAARWSRRSAASTPSSRAPRTGTWSCRVTERARTVVHVPRVLYHWRMLATSAAGGGEAAKPWAFEAGTRAVQAHCERIGLPAQGRARPRRPRRLPPRARSSSGEPLVSIVIPTAGQQPRSPLRGGRPRQPLRPQHRRDLDLRRTTRSSSSPTTRPRPRSSPSCARSPATGSGSSPSTGPFNFSAKINARRRRTAEGEHLLLLNDDMEVDRPRLDRADGDVLGAARDRRRRRPADLSRTGASSTSASCFENGGLPGPPLPRLLARLRRLLEHRPRRPEPASP